MLIPSFLAPRSPEPKAEITGPAISHENCRTAGLACARFFSKRGGHTAAAIVVPIVLWRTGYDLNTGDFGGSA
jgi:hypothetical protein